MQKLREELAAAQHDFSQRDVSIKEQLASTPLFGGNASAVERLYEQYLEDPASVPGGWRSYFESLGDPDAEIVHSKIRDDLLDARPQPGVLARDPLETPHPLRRVEPLEVLHEGLRVRGERLFPHHRARVRLAVRRPLRARLQILL